MHRSPKNRSRSAEGSQGGVPSWLIEENQRRSDGSGQEEASRSAYSGLCGSPDTRRTFYRSSQQPEQHQQQLDYHQQHHNYSNHQASHAGYQEPQPQSNPLQPRPQNQFLGSMQRVPTSEPIYMDIDPRMHQCTKNASRDGHRDSSSTPPAASYSTGISNARPPSRSHDASGVATDVTPTTPNQGRHSSGSASTPSPYRSPHSATPPTHITPSRDAVYSSIQRSPRVKAPGTSSRGGASARRAQNRSNSPNIPYVSPYVSPIAKEYRVQGGMFQNAAPFKAIRPPVSPHNHKRYDERPLKKDPYDPRREGLIMFGDDYDLGSINTGTSQQELLQKRRDVKKRRDGKYSKKKKSRERIINMPPRLLSMGSWDTSPITKLTSKDNSQHTPYKSGKDGKKPMQWNIMRTFSSPEDCSTDDSTRESGERYPHGSAEEHQKQTHNRPIPIQSDNVSLSSFPLLSTSAKEGLTTEVGVHYSQPGNIPQLELNMPHAEQQTYPSSHHHQQQRRHQHQKPTHPEYPQEQHCSPHGPQQPKGERPQHLDIYQRQHSEELVQLENHLRYLEEQHQQLEEEIQERERVDQKQEAPSAEYEDDRPRSVRFAASIAQDMEEQYEKTKGSLISQESPTSVARYHSGQTADNSNSSTSMLGPKALFGKPESILRRKKGTAPLDSTGRYPSATRGKSHVPVFTDGHGREVSPIRSPARQSGQQAAFQMGPQPSEDTTSIPDNPDDKDIAVLFDSEAELGLESMRRDFDEDSGMISDAFIEAVAAIVLQTAIRRFLAIRKVRRFLRGKDTQNSPRREIAERASPQRGAPSTIPANDVIEERRQQPFQPDGQPDKPSKQVQFASQAEDSLMVEESPQAQPEHFFYDLAAIQIQSVFRGWWVRDSINVDHYCTTLIQKTFRGFRARVEFDYDLYRVMVVQAVWRRSVAIRSARYMLALVVQLQAACRGFVVRKTLDSVGALPVRRVRASSAQKMQNQQTSNSKDGARSPRIRSFHERAKMRKKLRHPKAQPLVPLMQPSSMEEARIWHVGAIIIQTYWRSYVCRICYLQSISDVIVVQSIARRWLTQRWLGLGRGTSGPVTGAFAQNQGTMKDTHYAYKSQGQHSISTPPLPQARAQQQHAQQGHFNDPSRFGGARTVWKAGTNPVTQYNGTPNRANDPEWHSDGYSNRAQRHRQHYATNATVNRPSPRSSPSHQPDRMRSGSNGEAPRSKGWNADEEIDKQGTRNLLLAWKQKDKANTFTIRPRK